MNLTFFNYSGSRSSIRGLSTAIYVYENGLAYLSTGLANLLECKNDQAMNIAFDTDSKSYFLCFWPKKNADMPRVIRKVSDKSGVTRFRANAAAEAIMATQKEGMPTKGIRFRVDPECLSDPSLPLAQIYAMQMEKKWVDNLKTDGSALTIATAPESIDGTLDEEQLKTIDAEVKKKGKPASLLAQKREALQIEKRNAKTAKNELREIQRAKNRDWLNNVLPKEFSVEKAANKSKDRKTAIAMEAKKLSPTTGITDDFDDFSF